MPWLLAIVAVRLLALPAHATIDPFGERPLIAVSARGGVTATATLHGFLTRTLYWATPASRPAVVTREPAVLSDLRRLCENFPQSSVGPALAGWLSDGSVIATMQSPAIVDLDDTSGQYAPVVLHLRSAQCLNMGNGVAVATAGLYTAGYEAYVNGVPAPSNVVSQKERFVAIRWHDRTRESLGAGVALAINAAGNAAGADVPPGKGAAFAASPHARIWIGTAAIEPAKSAPVSVAYAIDSAGRVTGMLEDADGRHYAFVWKDGTLKRLDDVAPVAGWRFECGYAFAPDGAVVGVGTYRGVAAVFELRGL
jgi:probable HAF family extracellular repeat protein